MWGASLWAVYRHPGALRAWSCRTGMLFGAAAVYMLAAFAWSEFPAESLKDAARLAPILAVTAALPALLRNARGAAAGILATAVALTLILGADLVRLAWILGADALRLAHEYEPFAIGHSPNVGGAAAAAAAIVMGLAALNRAWSARCRAAAALAACLNLAYLVVIASRGAQAALAASCVVAALLVPSRHWIRALCLAAILGAAALFAVKPEWINPRFKDPISMRGFADRDVVWRHTWRLSREQHPALGHGYGPRVFRNVYTASHPPYSRFDFQHPHHYGLSALFAFGWVGAALLAAAWASLAWDAIRAAGRRAPVSLRYPALAAALLLAYVHAFGMADFPGSAVRMIMLWLIPCALLAAQTERDA